MAAGSAPGGRGDAVYVGWIRFYSSRAAQIAFSRSGDGGQTFSPPLLLSSGLGLHVAPQLAAAPGGHVSVGWLVGSALPGAAPARQWMETRASFDGGAHFGPIGRTISFWGLPGLEQPGSLRLFNGPSLADAGLHRLYMVWAQAQVKSGTPVIVAGAVRANIVVSSSDDAGSHWSSPIIVNDSAKGDRFEPQVATAAGDTAVVAFYDRRRNGVDLDLELSVVRQTASGLYAAPNVRLTGLPAPLAAIPFIPAGSSCLAQGRFFGDYIGLALHGTRAGVVWTGSTPAYPGLTDVRFASIPLTALSIKH
jgi:hypothetical protein